MFTRICPQCKQEVRYTNKSNRNRAKKLKIVCRKCVTNSLKVKYSGAGNPFYGKKHSPETTENIRQSNTGKKWSEERKEARSREYKELNHPSWKVNNYNRWVEKYGKEEADKKLQEVNKKHSINNSGSSNPMYGKPSPQGSGVGWKGWYKSNFFRSLRELSFLVYATKNNISFCSAEKKEWRIPYIDLLNKNRTYAADYLVEDKYLIEIKPLRLWTTPLIEKKKEAAVTFCKDKKWEYYLIDPPKLSDDVIRQLYLTSEIKFTERYEKMYQEKYANTSDSSRITGIGEEFILH